MDIDVMAAAIANWASTQPLVRRAHLFGSRVRGTHRLLSDLDVAVELVSLAGDEDLLTTWLCESPRLKASIAGVAPVMIDLSWYGGVDSTPRVHAGLKRSSLLVYDAETYQPTQKTSCSITGKETACSGNCTRNA